jgi:EmrB/QacA subfamily drug resistance transporter
VGAAEGRALAPGPADQAPEGAHALPPCHREQRGEVMDRKWWTLIAVSVAIFMLLLDITVVNVALPDIQRSLHSSFQDLQWVVDAYSLTLAAFLLTAGSLADRLGRRLVFATGLAVFTASSVVCGLSSTAMMLNLARAVQGIGGAMMFATSLALIAQAFQGRDRGTAFGVFGAVTGAAVAVGPLVGGIITDAIGWEWIFFVNLPIGLVAIALTLTRVKESRDPNASSIDWLGLVTFSGSLFLLVFALVRGNDAGWGSTQIVAMLSTSLILILLFILVELRQERPMLDLGLFRRPAFVGANAVAFAISASIFSMFLYLTLYIQNVLGYGPLQAGLRFLPITLLSFFVAPIAGRLTVRVPVRLLLGTGLLLISAGLLSMTAVDATSGWTALVPGFVLAGAGIGLVNPPLASAAIGVVPVERSGMASGINSTFRQVGIATGIAGLGAVFQHSVTQHTTTALARSGHAAGVVAASHGHLATLLQSGEIARVAGTVPKVTFNALISAYHVGFTDALTEILIIAAMIALTGSVLAFALVRSRDFVINERAAAPAEGDPAAVPVS